MTAGCDPEINPQKVVYWMFHSKLVLNLVGKNGYCKVILKFLTWSPCIRRGKIL